MAVLIWGVLRRLLRNPIRFLGILHPCCGDLMLSYHVSFRKALSFCKTRGRLISPVQILLLQIPIIEPKPRRIRLRMKAFPLAENDHFLLFLTLKRLKSKPVFYSQNQLQPSWPLQSSAVKEKFDILGKQSDENVNTASTLVSLCDVWSWSAWLSGFHQWVSPSA